MSRYLLFYCATCFVSLAILVIAAMGPTAKQKQHYHRCWPFDQ